MKKVCEEYPSSIIYVMSDVDQYYMKKGCKKVGTIFEVKL